MNCSDHKAHHTVTDDLGRTYIVGINGDGSTGYAHDVCQECGCTELFTDSTGATFCRDNLQHEAV